ncbi:Do family serine endopeptidase [Kordiimonas sp. SCSIO 12603]|uniref:Do family serine endopeptidase n=1 Tax=Kordiimonas sp. SCSIO 12603 TaxID=2829596 RepID=UPI002105D2ED|nr:Do family serine endopeptidase [Kordiimonas sp. SCSIO 12603]UTW56976.1 Do family serine endopeptidase [Kordiimonas sp. SCSIO 12603]
MRRLSRKIFLCGALVASAFAGASAQYENADRQVPSSNAQVQLSYAPIVKDTAPAVVNIYTTKVVRARRSAMFDDPLFKRFFGDQFSFGGSPKDRIQGSLGSGVIVRPNGVIVTNHHVIEGADEIRVVLSDRREFAADVVLADPKTDLAILQINAREERLPTLTLADSDNVLVGDLVLAIGNPFGVGQTVTSGIVSATARTQQGISDFGFFIQTDAAVNPGNSGGALVGMQGQLLGINTAIYSRTGASNGIGFAVPANMVNSVLRAALNEGQLARPWLGIRGQSVTNELASGLGLDRAGGILVDEVYPGSPAALADVQIGDVIMAVDGKEVIDEPGLNFRVATMENGADVPLAVLSEGFIQEKTLTLSLPPEPVERNLTKLDGRHPFQGVTVANLSPRFNEEIQVDPFLEGVVVLRVERRTAAGRYQFVAPGDIILGVNGNTVERVEDLASLDENAERFVYQVQRRGRVRECVIVPNRSYRCRDIR